MRKNKLVPVMGIMMVATSFIYADIQAAVVEIGKEVIDKAAEVAMKDKTKTTLSNSYLRTNINTQHTIVVGNVGITASGDSVDINHATVSTNIRMKDTAVIGDVGITLGN